MRSRERREGRQPGFGEGGPGFLLRLAVSVWVVTAGWPSIPIWAAPLIPAYERFADEIAPEERATLLVTELSCTRCHVSSTWLGKEGPRLDGIAKRLQPAWVRRFLHDPQKTDPGTTMPDVFANEPPEIKAEKIELLVHFLGSQSGGWRAPALFKYSDPHHGGREFRRIGCAACHLDPVEEKGRVVSGMIALEGLERKYGYGALTDFLKEPLRHRPGGRMPDLGLGDQDAADMAAYLMGSLDEAENSGRSAVEDWPVDDSKAARGREIFFGAGCGQCHQIDGIEGEVFAAPPFALLGKSSAGCARVGYGLSAEQRRDLGVPLPEPDAGHRVRHTLAANHCYACHDRDGIGGPEGARRPFFTGDETLGNEGVLPPALDGVGRKLRPEWLGKVLGGHGKLRSYLDTRMPTFGLDRIDGLAADWVKIDEGEDDGGEAWGEQEGERLEEAGRILLGTEGGLGCITCHDLGGRQGLTLRALTLSGSAERYHYAWFRDHLLDPQRTRPGTLMPSFWPGGRGSNRTVLGGDSEKQIRAIWRYLGREGAAEDEIERPLGYPDFEPGRFELVPRERALVQRTFMEGVGTHAIAVGYPEGIHLAFDADACEVSVIWRGRFLDAYKSWFSRLEPSAEPLGGDVRWIREASPEGQARRFLGYQLAEDGVPTFRYREGEDEVAMECRPNGADAFVVRKIVRRGGEVVKEESEVIGW